MSLGKVFLNKANPRKSYKKDDIVGLWETIKENGLLHPVTARPHPDGDGTFQLVVGERRFRAHQYGKAKEINAIVRDLSDKECAEIMLAENIHREDVDPVDEAKAIAEAMKDGMTISEIAARLGKSKSWIAPRVVMAHMSDKILELYKSKKITSRHLFALATISDLETRDRLAEECAADCESGVLCDGHFAGLGSLGGEQSFARAGGGGCQDRLVRFRREGCGQHASPATHELFLRLQTFYASTCAGDRAIHANVYDQ